MILHASVPNCKPGFIFDGKSVKQFAGGGCLYVHMTQDVSESEIDDSSEQSSPGEETDPDASRRI